jgi:hypothetical protein
MEETEEAWSAPVGRGTGGWAKAVGEVEHFLLHLSLLSATRG